MIHTSPNSPIPECPSQIGGNKSLLTLRLDYNGTLGSEGVANLCRGVLGAPNTNTAADPPLSTALTNGCSLPTKASKLVAELGEAPFCGKLPLDSSAADATSTPILSSAICYDLKND